jgi:hypothetical protein
MAAPVHEAVVLGDTPSLGQGHPFAIGHDVVCVAQDHDDPRRIGRRRTDPDKVRARLRLILGEAKAARVLPWDAARASLYRTIFPQLTLWLPDDEAAQLRFEFETEIARLEAA